MELWQLFGCFAKWPSLKKYGFIAREKAAHLWTWNEKVLKTPSIQMCAKYSFGQHVNNTLKSGLKVILVFWCCNLIINWMIFFSSYFL